MLYEVITEEEINLEDLDQIDASDLNRLLEDAIKNEDYEKASMIRDELNRRKAN